LFSSNEETSRRVGQALLELDFAVDSYREIFAALEKITTRNYDIVVVDGKDGAEAAFLLKVALESRRMPAAFPVVLAGSSAVACDPGGSALLLRGPFFSEQIKYDLLTSDAFMAEMRRWFPRGEPQPDHAAADVIGQQKEPARRRAQFQPIAAQPLAADPLEPSRLSPRTPLPRETGGFDPLEDVDANMASPSAMQTLFEAANAEAQSPARGGPLLPLLLCVGLAAAILFTDYVFDEHPWWDSIASAALNLQHSFGKPRIPPSRAPSAAANSLARASRPPRFAARTDGSKIRVIEVRANKAPRPLAGEANNLMPEAEVTAQQLQAQPFPVSAASLPQPTQSIPESLTAGSRPDGSEGDLPGGVPARLVRSLLPVNLTGDLAEKLLLQKTPPSYPEQAVKAGLQGAVVLEALIGTDGMIRDLKLLSGPMLLGKAACEAVKQWRYRPLLLNGHAVEAQTLVTVDFKLP
jgi:TonB family protein